MRQPLVMGNWKMHGSLAANAALLQGVCAQAAELSGVTLAVCPPSVYLSQASELLENSAVALGAQQCAQAQHGAYTGEVAAQMLADIGCQYVLVGHSERRSLYSEGDVVVAEKVQAALQAGLVPVLCVGETLAQREAGDTLAVVSAQLQAVLSQCEGLDSLNMVLAYEPVWAIGTGKTATPEQAQDVHAHLRQEVARMNEILAQRLQILYGGSVKPANAEEIFAKPDIDGGLIGGASLVVDDFIAIAKAAS